MIIPLSSDRISDVVSLHEKVLGHTLNSRIGTWFLGALYGATREAVGNGSCAIWTEGPNPSGFISWCLDHEELERDIMGSLSLKDKAMVVGTLAISPTLWSPFIRQRRFGAFIRRTFGRPYATILTLGVAPDVQGRGVGKALIEHVKEAVRRVGLRVLFVDTEETNTKAVAFYERNGFTRVATNNGNIVLRCSV